MRETRPFLNLSYPIHTSTTTTKTTTTTVATLRARAGVDGLPAARRHQHPRLQRGE
jgi:hypothetical protein